MKASDTLPNSKKRNPLQMEEKEDFVRAARSTFQKDVDADRHNIEPAREDMQFAIGDQWDINDRNRRQALRKPVLTVNRLPAFIAQYLGSWEQTDTTLTVMPTKGGTKLAADIRKGLIRSITREPMAKHALYTAMETAYICGQGNFGIELVDNEYDVFEKDIRLKAYDDPFSVVWDRASREPSGADARRCFAMEWITQEDYRDQYPNAKPNSKGWQGDELDYTTMTAHGWEVEEMVRICYFWQMKDEPVTLGLEAETGDVIDVSDWTEDQIAAGLAVDEDGQPIMRETTRPYAECYVLGDEVLDGPFRLNISRLPVFRVEGWALQEAAVRYRWGFVRNAKDPQRLHNYWRSILAEELQKSPASKWLLDSTAMQGGLADKFRNAHRDGDNVLFWDSQSDGAKPEFIPPPMMNQAVLTEAQMSVQDIKDVTNKHEASLGVQSNEVSGKAITARQRVSELGDRIYLANMNIAQGECAKVINQLIPEVYDTNRVIKITADDDQVVLQEINGIYGDQTPDITGGKYDIVSTVGPSYATKREEAVDTMLTLMNHMPQTANYIADILARNMDIPGADEISERLMSLLPPGMVDPERLSPRAQQRFQAQMEQQQEQQAQQQQVQMIMMQKQLEKLSAEIQDISARAAKSMAQAEVAASQVGVEAASVESKHALGQEKNIIDAARVGVDIDNQRIDVAKMGVDMAMAVDKSEREQRNDVQEGQGTGAGQQTQAQASGQQG